MTQRDDILTLARSRNQGWPYAGAVTPQEAYQLITLDAGVQLIDVRTNADFLAQLNALAGPEQVLLFLCRSGVRSRNAAKLATEHGYQHCYDILEGFEGDKDAAGHRKQLGGWCKAGLPWMGA